MFRHASLQIIKTDNVKKKIIFFGEMVHINWLLSEVINETISVTVLTIARQEHERLFRSDKQ